MVKLYTKCIRCAGTGVVHIGGDVPDENPCAVCHGPGYIETSQSIDLTSADDRAVAAVASLQVCVDQIAEVVKSTAAFAEKIYEIVSKG
jgi:excinuclease UvrABC ATPase subunit